MCACVCLVWVCLALSCANMYCVVGTAIESGEGFLVREENTCVYIRRVMRYKNFYETGRTLLVRRPYLRAERGIYIRANLNNVHMCVSEREREMFYGVSLRSLAIKFEPPGLR